MVPSLSTKRASPIGVEFGSRTLQMVQFSADRKRLLEAVRWDLPKHREGDLEGQRVRDVSEAIHQARLGRRFRGRDAVLCLGARELFVQNIRVPKGPTTDLARTVQQEASTRLPFPVDEAEIRFLCAGDVRQGDQMKREIILLACHQPVVQQLLATVEKSGLRPVAIDVEPSALLRSYSRYFRRDHDREERVILVRVGPRNTAVVISQGGEVYFIKYIDVGGEQLDEAVARHLNIPVDEASTLRRHNGDRRADEQDRDISRIVAESTRPVLERLLGELSLCLRYHSVAFRGQAVGRLILSGSEAVYGLLESLGARLDVKCELGDPLRGYDNSLSALRRGQWDVAAGLALKGPR